MNVKNGWGDCVEHAKVESPVPMIRIKEVKTAPNYLKSGKGSGPTSVVVEILRFRRKGCLEPDKDF